MTTTFLSLDDVRAYMLSLNEGDEPAPRLDSLPTFGGEAPADTREVWSWDETRLLVGSGRDLEIVPRHAAPECRADAARR